jgi:uncharacterized alpha-E superfamily protein
MCRIFYNARQRAEVCCQAQLFSIVLIKYISSLIYYRLLHSEGKERNLVTEFLILNPQIPTSNQFIGNKFLFLALV